MYKRQTQFLAASIRTANHVKDCAMIGADVVTAPPAVIKALASHVLTDKGLDLSLIHISEPTRLLSTSYDGFCLKKKNYKNNPTLS